MAKAFTCDGCGTPITEADMMELGYVQKSQYCAGCGEKVKSLFGWIDKIHTEVAAAFRQRRNVAVIGFKSENPDFRELPDNLLQFAPITGENTDV
jgi:predicted Fe-S protein YdhL (DUF1289 family)